MTKNMASGVYHKSSATLLTNIRLGRKHITVSDCDQKCPNFILLNVMLMLEGQRDYITKKFWSSIRLKAMELLMHARDQGTLTEGKGTVRLTS
jgi:hypothetical protein